MLDKEWDSRAKMWLGTLKRRLYIPMEEIHFTYRTTFDHLTCGEAMTGQFKPIREGDVWGKPWEYGWFRAELRLGPWAIGKRVVVNLGELGGEATLFLNGQVWGTRRAGWVDEPLHFACDNWITRDARGDETFLLAAEVYAGHEMPPESFGAAAGPVPGGRRWERPNEPDRVRLGKCTFGIWDEEAYHLWLEATVLYEIAQNACQDSLRTAEAEGAIRELTMRLDLTLEGDAFQENVGSCRAFLTPYLQCVNGSTAPVIHAIGHAHIDLAWLWPLEETQRKSARTMAAQLRHMDEYPEYKMILSQPQLYEMIREYYPELFDRLREKAASGQLIPEGGMWVEADTNIPSGESLVRQFLYGKAYFREEFGVESRLLWLPDVFGYSAALPQIMRGCGIDSFATAKIFWTYNGGEPFPYHYFNWIGLDGTCVRSIIHMDYSSETGAEFTIKKWRDRRQRDGLKRLISAVGYGDGGGGPTRDHIENVRLLTDCEGVPKVRFDAPAEVFDLLAQEMEQPPEYVGELYFQAHRGTYTTQARTKKLNRQCELTLREAELWSALASFAGRLPYPEAELEADWKTVLKNQFHDIIPGSSIHRVYERANREQAEVLEDATALSAKAAGALSQEQNGCVTLFNSLSWPRRAQVPLPEGWEGARTAGSGALPCQRGAGQATVEVTLPPVGAVTLFPAGFRDAPEAATFRDGVLENGLIRAALNERGEIVSLYDKETYTEWTAGPMNVLRLYQDVPGSYEAWDIDSMRPECPIPGNAVITVRESGSLFCEIQVERTIGKSTLTQFIRLERGSRQITFRTKVDWHETQKLLKVEFPVDIAADELISEIQYGHIRRPNHRSRQLDKDRFEVCNHKWSALAESERGFAVMNDSKYGVSCEHSTIALTLLRSPVWPDETADQGLQEFTYAVNLWNTSLPDSGLVNAGYELNIPVTVLENVSLDGSFLEVSDPNVILNCVKRAEDRENALILRLYESSGSRRRCELQTSLPVVCCETANMLEKPEGRLPIENGSVQLDFRPFEIKTLILS